MRMFKRHYLDVKGFPETVRKSPLLSVLKWIAVVTALIIIQTNIHPFELHLNFTIIVPVFLGLRRSSEHGMLAGVLVGLLEDTLSNTILGPHMLAMGVVGFLAPLLAGRFFIWTPLFGVAALFAMSATDSLIVLLSRKIFFTQIMPLKSALLAIMFQSLVNAPVGYFIRPRDE